MGIEPEDQMRVFERFYRTPYAEAIQQGMGLGLAIANEIVRAHGGTIEVSSRRGEGATFTVRIPR
jgi:signal transduction histidine kinase